HATISAITVEYGLYEGQFWLPKRNVAEGEIEASFMRVPVKVEESFRYNSVNSHQPIATQPVTVGDDTTWATAGSLTIGTSDRERRQRMEDTSLVARLAREDSLIKRDTLLADSLRAAAAAKRAKGDTLSARELESAARYRAMRARQILRRREGCAHGDSTYYAGTTSRYGDALRMAIRMPCDTTRLADSPDLPGSIYGTGEEIFGTSDRDQLLESLDFDLQPGWSPQKPVLHTGLDLVRYNRIEGLSLGVSATSVLGKGYTARLVARIGTADVVPNADLSLIRSNGRSELQATAYRRLAVANDDWGAPLSFGASLANALYARDEGFYYRSWGGELAGSRDIVFGAKSQWRLFAERQDSVGIEPNTQASLGNLLGNVRFGQNIAAVPLTALGARVSVTRSFGGADPSSTRLDTRLRGEGAFTDRSDSLGNTGYGRFLVDATLARNVGRFGVALTGAAGSSIGDLPPQRAFYIGGLHTVRGQFARPDGEPRVGDAFWLGRAELGLGRMLAARPALFYDIGWAGSRNDFAQPGRPMSGAGIGLSLLDGLFRFDVARGIWPEKRWRADFSVDARF
ncbi:MAG TPA: BamA/TamA family outer membrane protein, partial [Gemmatimonadaceae bacterium]|nr:BamA/TamA family outer membrane protein [Gemmatimonadaceae bacterium]